MKSNLHKKVMRRVYYSFAIRFVSEPMLWQGFVLGACVALFGRLTHVAAISHNLGSTSIDNTPTFIWNSFMHAVNNGEALTALVVLFIVGLTAKFFYRAFQALTGAGKMRTI
jgi:cell division protein FtsX